MNVKIEKEREKRKKIRVYFEIYTNCFFSFFFFFFQMNDFRTKFSSHSFVCHERYINEHKGRIWWKIRQLGADASPYANGASF